MKAARFSAALLIAGIVAIGPKLVRSQGARPGAAPAAAPATSPSATLGVLEVRANQAFNRGEYALAMPMYQKVAEQLKDQPDRLTALQERMRVCQKNIQNPPPAATAAVAMLDPQAALSGSRPPTIVDGPRKPHVRPKDGDMLVLDIKELGNFDYDPSKGGNIPDDVTKLAGAKIRTHGFMIPLDQAENITEFALVPSLFACCFGQPPQIQHTIVVHTPKGKAVNYYPEEITVDGTLKVDEKKDDGYIVSIFEMDCTSVRPVAK